MTYGAAVLESCRIPKIHGLVDLILDQWRSRRQIGRNECCEEYRLCAAGMENLDGVKEGTGECAGGWGYVIICTPSYSNASVCASKARRKPGAVVRLH